MAKYKVTQRKKRIRRLKKSISQVRAQRRALFAQQPLDVRRAALALLPKSRRQVGRKIGHHRRQVLRLRVAVTTAPDAATRTALEQDLAQSIKELAALVGVSHAKKKRALRGGISGVEKVGSTQVKTRLRASRAQLATVNEELKTLHKRAKNKKGPKLMKKHRQANIQVLSAKRVHLKRRIGLLKRGLDFERAVRLHPSRVAIQRRKLVLPRAWSVPNHADVTVLIRLLGTQVPRLSHESGRAYVQRLRAYTQRSLLRLINLRASNVTGSPAITQAAEATIAEDGPALDSESEAGGVVIDAMAEGMDDIIQPVSDQLEAVEEDYQTEIPAGDPTPEELDQILAFAEEAEAEAMTAPIEASDEMEEDLLAADEPFAPDFEELDLEEPFSPDFEELDLEEFTEEDEGPNMMLVMGVIGGLGLLWFLSGR